jgi:adenylate kinase
MTEGVRLVMLGRQGAGKGTQAIRLAQHFVVPHISTGDMLRAAVTAGTEFGLRAKEIMDGGGLVSDEIMVGVVDERLNESDTTKRGFILDGFPRTVPQGESLEKITAGRPLDLVIDLEVPE